MIWVHSTKKKIINDMTQHFDMSETLWFWNRGPRMLVQSRKSLQLDTQNFNCKYETRNSDFRSKTWWLLKTVKENDTFQDKIYVYFSLCIVKW